MIDFSNYTAKAIEAAMLDQVDSSFDKREGSLIQTAIAPVAWWLEGNYLTLNQIQNNASPFNAVGDALDDIVALRGVTRKEATPAVRTGTFDAAIPSGSRFKTINGSDSVVFYSGDLISEESGTYYYKLTCETAGTIGNSYTGSILPITAISGLSSATIGEILVEGTEEETDDSLRSRFFNTFDSQPYGGNISEYRQSILALSGVGAVQIYPAYNGGGTVLCSILNDYLEPASSALINSVQEAICPIPDGDQTPSPNGYGVAPIGASVTITTGTEFALNISADIEFQSTIINGLELYSDAIREQIETYIASVKSSWGTALLAHQISYPVTIYAARIIYAILSVPEVVNVTNLTINGQSGDLALTETSALQQVPVVGDITLNEV